MEIKRYLEKDLLEFLDTKIILLSGPRQVGKTFLSRRLETKYQYLNFDRAEDRDLIISKSWVRDGGLLIFDEIHKMKKWKQWIKGVYDTEDGKNKYLLTGSSRMDTFKKMGDSLAGRHVSYRLNPLSLKELSPKGNTKNTINDMMTLGCFPEPFLSGSNRKASIWRRSHLDMIIRQDLIQLESVRDLISIEMLIQILSKRVGQQIVYANIAKELSVSPHTVKKWIQVLESLFVVFTVYPYTKNVLDSIKKEPKIYFYDLGQVSADVGFKLENLLALHLLKRNQYLEDTEGKKIRLCYLRDKKKREIDFAIEENGHLTHLIEVKTGDDQFNKNLDYYSLRLSPELSVQLVLDLKRPKDFENYKIRSLGEFLLSLET